MLPAYAQPVLSPDLRIESIADGLTFPWSLTFLPAGGALVSERPGRLRRLTASGLAAPLSGVPPVVNLLDVAPDADFTRSSRLFISMVRFEGDEAALEVWAARLGEAALLDAHRIYRASGQTSALPVLHSGRLLVLAPFSVLVSVSDVDDRDSRAQDDASHAGKIVHLSSGAQPRIAARGVRNAQGMARDGAWIWFTDHGPSGGDELNALRHGANYGWPFVSFGSHYDGRPIPATAPDALEVQMPVVHWTPAIAPSSLVAYEGAEFPEWRGSLFVGSLAGRHLRRLELKDGALVREETLLADLGERIRDVRVDDRGRIHVLTDGLHGRVLRIARKNRKPPPAAR